MLQLQLSDAPAEDQELGKRDALRLLVPHRAHGSMRRAVGRPGRPSAGEDLSLELRGGAHDVQAEDVRQRRADRLRRHEPGGRGARGGREVLEDAHGPLDLGLSEPLPLAEEGQETHELLEVQLAAAVLVHLRERLPDHAVGRHVAQVDHQRHDLLAGHVAAGVRVELLEGVVEALELVVEELLHEGRQLREVHVVVGGHILGELPHALVHVYNVAEELGDHAEVLLVQVRRPRQSEAVERRVQVCLDRSCLVVRRPLLLEMDGVSFRLVRNRHRRAGLDAPAAVAAAATFNTSAHGGAHVKCLGVWPVSQEAPYSAAVACGACATPPAAVGADRAHGDHRVREVRLGVVDVAQHPWPHGRPPPHLLAEALQRRRRQGVGADREAVLGADAGGGRRLRNLHLRLAAVTSAILRG
mmetsp:Transcript_89694/g.254313  ORF Transcript_89694/g.254313 Transcript_89694/m.254313 type:complete len:414 (-) Transcript_89694:1024-2265(-)